MTTFQGITVLFSTLQDAVGLGVVKPSVDWRYISAHVIYPQLNGAETALNEVSEICAGECFSRIGARTSRSFFWHPAKFAGAQSESEEPGEWIDAVYSTTKGCVHSWASGHQSIVHRLSGGLDSCVVLACLGDVPHRPRLAALNCYTDAAAGDERTYARDAAARSRCRFVEQRIGDGVDMRRILELRPAARPGYYLTSLQAAGTESALAREVSATALFGGGWGDQLFFRSRNDYAAMDYLNRHGVSGRWLSVVRDVAQLSRSTVWRVLGRTLANTLRHSTWNPLPGEPPQNTLVEGGIYREFHKPECVLHPWFRDASHLPWGKLWHILLLAAPADFQRPLPDDDDPESIEPLRSQPLIELCLRIPTYVMTWGAGDRLIERMAFRRELPERVLQRLSKGFVDEGLQIMVRQNAGFVRELLLDGLLVRERILDRRKLERMLGEDALRNGRVSAELFAHISTEAWLSRVTS
jgi:asparagine synthase (glutamine-hydrolysing)